MNVELKSNLGIKKRQKGLTEKEFKALNDAINLFEEENPKRRKLVVDLDFVVPLIILLRNEEE